MWTDAGVDRVFEHFAERVQSKRLRVHRRNGGRTGRVESLELRAAVLLAQKKHVGVVLLDPRAQFALGRLRDDGLVHQRALDLLRAGAVARAPH